LPNGWRISPAGEHLTVGDLPLAMAQSPDGKQLAVVNGGYAKPTISLIDLDGFRVAATIPLEGAWAGLAWAPSGDRIYQAAGNENAIDELKRVNGSWERAGKISLGSPLAESFLGGLALTSAEKRLFVVDPLGQTLTAVDLTARRVEKTVHLPEEPYTCLLDRDEKTLFVSLWGGAKVALLDSETLDIVAEIPVGEHPNAMSLSRDGARLFVACANTNSVWAIDVAARKAQEQISVAMFPNAPEGATPNGLGISPDGRTLLVANADNNAVAVVDIERPGAGRVQGYIPAGWYPTAAQFTKDGRRILILSGKGLSSRANPRGPQPGHKSSQYIGEILVGAVSILPAPSADQLALYTKTVYTLTPYRDSARLAPERAPAGSPIPQRVGGRSPIHHVFYIIRENRTYDQILGDIAAGNGDPSLCLFGEEVTPNAHALAREFVLADNFFVNAEVSHDGHSFSTAAYATDVTVKVWPILYADRGGQYISEGGGPDRNPYGNVSAPSVGYIWDACRRGGVSLRDYGEFAVAGGDEAPVDGAGKPPYLGSVPGIRGFVCPDYPPFDLTIPDGHRVDVWLAEFRKFEEDGKLPRLSIIRLGNDHTQGTKSGVSTPRAMIAENDLALGRLIEAISKSRYWKDSAIFVLEDDAQNGPDHVDAHRSVLLVASPYTRRGSVDSTLYTTCGVLRTIELLLGLPPMSQCDAAATPLYNAFQKSPDLRPFRHREARVSIAERNETHAPGSAASARMDFSRPDRAPERELNEILWKSVKGASSQMPPPVHAAFVRPSDRDDD
jgi:DNA-binding beta-propeller fold protein YncE